MYIKVIACEIFFRELCYCAAHSKNIIDIEFLEQGFHDTPQVGFKEIQKKIDLVPANKYDAIVLGYGLCSKITSGIVSRHTRIVIPRVHDCIAIFLGSNQRYRRMFEEESGTYYYTSGWVECVERRGGVTNLNGFLLPANATDGFNVAFSKLEEKYGKENAQYLISELAAWEKFYSKGTLINFEFAKHLKLDEKVKEICNSRGWKYDEIDGDINYLQRLLDGEWNKEDFLVLSPGEKVISSFDENIIDKIII